MNVDLTCPYCGNRFTANARHGSISCPRCNSTVKEKTHSARVLNAKVGQSEDPWEEFEQAGDLKPETAEASDESGKTQAEYALADQTRRQSPSPKAEDATNASKSLTPPEKRSPEKELPPSERTRAELNALEFTAAAAPPEEPARPSKVSAPTSDQPKTEKTSKLPQRPKGPSKAKAPQPDPAPKRAPKPAPEKSPDRAPRPQQPISMPRIRTGKGYQGLWSVYGPTFLAAAIFMSWVLFDTFLRPKPESLSPQKKAFVFQALEAHSDGETDLAIRLLDSGLAQYPNSRFLYELKLKLQAQKP